MQAIPNVAIHHKACNLFSKQMQFSARSFYCATKVNMDLSITVPGAAAVIVQITAVQALQITERVQ